ncbi:MAG: AAA family ATPase [Cellulosilyticaceae bacterium]
MRPKQLIMKAFGPYGGTEVIDFTLLADTNMFLIHGPTGAGKTTILDAICYALYGQTNGGERTAETMRSKFAKEDEGAEVELIFSIRENEYKITRSPRFERPKKRGEGTTTEETRATLYQKSGEDYVLLAAKPVEVERKIQELLTFNINQFRQVIMIAQNKFRELLTAPSVERQKILQDIFETGIYQSMEKNLEQINARLTDQVKEKAHSYGTILDAIDHEGHETLQQYKETKVIGNAKEVIQLLGEMKVTKNETIAHQTVKIKNLKQQLEVLQKQLIEATEKQNNYTKKLAYEKQLTAFKEEEPKYQRLKEQLEKANQIAPLVVLEESLQTAESSLKHLNQVIEDAKVKKAQLTETFGIWKEKKESLLAGEGHIEELTKEYQHLESYRQRVESLAEDKNNYQRIEQTVKQITEKIATVESGMIKRTEALKEGEEELGKKEHLMKSMTDTQVLLGKVGGILERQVEIEEKQKEIQETRNQFVILRTQITELKQMEIAHKDAYDTLFESWMLGQAVQLADKLEEGAACPVCGSTHHPKKAESHEGVVSAEQLKEKEKTLTALRTQIIQKEQQQEKEKEYGIKLKEMIEATQKKIEAQLIESNLNTGEVLTKDYQQQLILQLEEDKKTLQHLQKLQENLQQSKEKLEEEKKELQKLMEEKNALQLQAMALQTKIEAITKELPPAFQEKEALYGRLETIQKERQAFEAEKTAVTERLEKLMLEVARYETLLEVNEKDYGVQEKEYKLKKESFSQTKQTLGVEEESVYEALKEVLRQQVTHTEELQDYTTKRAIVEAAYEEIQETVKDFDSTLVEELQEKFRESTEAKEQIQLAKNTLESQVTEYTKQCDTLEALYTTNEEVLKEQQLVSRMTMLAKGKNTKGLSFERYIQSSIFDEVLESANQKLRPMTSSRYELFRTDDLKRKNAQAGLDIAVIDNYVGEVRPVNTLSGGESFMAALALALGLADVISRLAGAATLDTMFIDEGFGTLDEESLEMAIKVLLGLQDTGRLVGIISHVRELREQIPARLEIISTKKGSHAAFRV